VNLERKVRDLNYEISDLQKQLHMQSNAIDMARDLKQKTDLILEDYKKSRLELDRLAEEKENIINDVNQTRSDLERCQEELRIT